MKKYIGGYRKSTLRVIFVHDGINVGTYCVQNGFKRNMDLSLILVIF